MAKRSQRDRDAEQERVNYNTLPAWLSRVTAQPAAFDPTPEPTGDTGYPLWQPKPVAPVTAAVRPRQSPAQKGQELGAMFGDVIASLPQGSVAQNVTAATLGAKTDGAAQLMTKPPVSTGLPTADEAMAAADTPSTIAAEVARRSAGRTEQRLGQEAGAARDDAVAALAREVTSDQGQRFEGTGGRAYVGDNSFIDRGYTAALDAALAQGKSPDSITDSGTGYMIKDYETVKQSDKRRALERALSGNRVIDVQYLAGLIADSRTASHTAGKTSEQVYTEALAAAHRINSAQRDRLKGMNPADLKDYGEAFTHAQLNGMSMSEALGFAAKWKTIQGSGDEQIAAAKRAEGGGASSAPAAKSTTAEVAAAARAALDARQGGAGAPSTSMRRVELEKVKLVQEITKNARAEDAELISSVAKEQQLSDAIAIDALAFVTAPQANGKTIGGITFAEWQAMTDPMAKRRFMIAAANIYRKYLIAQKSTK